MRLIWRCLLFSTVLTLASTFSVYLTRIDFTVILLLPAMWISDKTFARFLHFGSDRSNVVALLLIATLVSIVIYTLIFFLVVKVKQRFLQEK